MPKNSESRSPFWWLRWVPAVVLVLLVLELIYVVGRVAIVPVLASFSIAYLLNPLVDLFRDKGLSRPMAALASMGTVLVITGALLMGMLPELLVKSGEAGEKLQTTYLTRENAQRQRAVLKEYSPALERALGPTLERLIANPVEVLGTPQNWFGGSLAEFLATAGTLADLFVVPFFVFYILVDFEHWRRAGEEVIPPRYRDPLSRLLDEVGRILQAYVRGQLLIAILMGLMYAVGFAALGVPAWLGIAMLAGFLNVIPYVGTVLGVVLATGLTLGDGAGYLRVLGVLGVMAVVQCVEGYYLTPRILGGRLSLHPMAVFLGLLIGGKLFGFLGIVLAVPTIAVAKVFLKFLFELYKASHFYHRGDLEPHEQPAENMEERVARAADTVLASQQQASSGDEVMAPLAEEDPEDGATP